MTKVSVTRLGNTAATTPGLRRLFRQAARLTLDELILPIEVEISLLLTDDETIQALNRDYRGLDFATDVLSFAMNEGEGVSDGGELRQLGDIVISRERAAQQAEAYGHSVEREEVFLFVHGLLHLLGYDHEKSAKAEREMFALQERIMAKMGLART
ncbi:MAG: rRNA maturation RNase YbeY [Clostridia bacterium]|nr:rRNA maturation RNase YbeY [Clostridia bacterium]